MESEESRRICREETERARQLITDELHAHKKEEPSTMNQLLSQIWTLQDRANQQLESQRLELYQANQWADQAQRENSRLFGELSTKNRNITQEIVKT